MAPHKVTASRMNREDRSMIQIMYNRGAKISHIAQHINVRETTVSNVLEDIPGRDDQGYDFGEVYPALTKKNILQDNKVPCISQTEFLRSSLSVSAKKSVERCPPQQSPRSPPRCKMEDKRHLSLPVPLRISKSSELPAPMESRSTMIDVEGRLSPPPDLDTFLRNLEHNLSKLASDLEAEGIITIEHLLAFAPWSEERLHELFKETLPHITVPQRFILVHGVKKYA